MPSKLPIIKANTTQVNIDKMKVIAETNKRSVAKELEWLIERHIQEYENIHGEIELKPSAEEWAKVLNDSSLSAKDKIMASVDIGRRVGEYGIQKSDK